MSSEIKKIRDALTYARVSVPDYQGIGVGKLFQNFIAKLYSSQTKMPFYIITSNPQIIKGGLDNGKLLVLVMPTKARKT